MINADTCDRIRREVNLALQAVAQRNGVTFNLGRMTFTATDIRCKLTVLDGVIGDGAITKHDVQHQELLDSLHVFDLTQEHLQKVFSIDGNEFQLWGYNPRARKKPIVIKRIHDGAHFIISTDMMKRKLGLPAF